jgi:hypothetical protein
MAAAVERREFNSPGHGRQSHGAPESGGGGGGSAPAACWLFHPVESVAHGLPPCHACAPPDMLPGPAPWLPSPGPKGTAHPLCQHRPLLAGFSNPWGVARGLRHPLGNKTSEHSRGVTEIIVLF